MGWVLLWVVPRHVVVLLCRVSRALRYYCILRLRIYITEEVFIIAYHLDDDFVISESVRL